ncbi:glucosidase 2 subunit beta-like [Mercenaria mercenaria]|uniref:glucosidase 2 subunit beta-like n=1 Tax=Mercenaria mercenaria TaxID=6596 RepID=UPI00234E775F|nr:glucosidase 2 subunit beta-like [Mercenaria mercenaria]
MNLHLVRRKYRILSLVAVTGTIFLCFQLLSFKVLNFTSRHDSKYQSKQSAKVLDEFPPESNVVYVKDKQKDKVDKLEDKHRNKNEILELVRGTHISQVETYKADSSGNFQCVQSKKVIPFSSVNDDYCDCDDGSDEPGTSACPESRFYCTFQNPDIEPQHILGSRVNDGVCDCCDGSDEWGGISVFSGVHLTDKRMKSSLQHAPCKDDCQAVLKLSEEDDKIRALGKKLKLAYIEKGRRISKSEQYGPQGVFYKLSTECYEYDAHEYKYKLCPFKSVSQQAFPSAAIDLGKTPVWKIRLPGHFVLKMDKGDASRCPMGKHRNTVITFICGLTDKIVKVSEEEKCTYSMKFSTPAAC